jgi:hypothetical protein
MAESGCLRDGHFQNLEVSGKTFFSRANNVTQTASSANVTSNGATGTIVLADHTYNCRTGVDVNGTDPISLKTVSQKFRLHNNHINKDSIIFLNLDHNGTLHDGGKTFGQDVSRPNLAFSVTLNTTRSLNCGINITAIGNGRRVQSIGNLKYFVIN